MTGKKVNRGFLEETLLEVTLEMETDIRENEDFGEKLAQLVMDGHITKEEWTDPSRIRILEEKEKEDENIKTVRVVRRTPFKAYMDNLMEIDTTAFLENEIASAKKQIDQKLDENEFESIDELQAQIKRLELELIK